MTIQDLNNSLSADLKQFIKSEGYVDSGKLINSIKFTSTFVDNKLNIKFDTMDYIQYLDDGNLLTKFFAKDSVIALIQRFYSKNLDLGLYLN